MVRRLLEREAGFGLIESVMAMSMFAVVSAPLAGVMLASVATQKTSHERTLAVQASQTQIEQIRALPYDSVGVLNGNPAGTITAAVPASQLGIQGLDATVATKVSFMDDAPATSYRTRADYKRVIVTVTRNADGRRLVQQATYVAPPGAGAYAGQSQGIVIAQVIDLVLNTPLVNATVNLTGGPSPTRPAKPSSLHSCRRPRRSPRTTSPSPQAGTRSSRTTCRRRLRRTRRSSQGRRSRRCCARTSRARSSSPPQTRTAVRTREPRLRRSRRRGERRASRSPGRS
jgi:type II secretory pathway pseudopilin PulG